MILKNLDGYGRKSEGNITLTFGPGVVKLLPVADLISDNGQRALEEIRSFGSQPIIEFPESEINVCALLEKYGISRSGNDKNFRGSFHLGDFRSLNPNKPIEKIIVDLVAMLKAWVKQPFDSRAYKVFNDYTESEDLVIAQFVESWVPEANIHSDILNSYSGNDEYVVLEAQGVTGWSNMSHQYHVFRKTNYLINRRATIDAANKEKERLEQEAVSSVKAAQFEETIRRSSYQTYVYLMEDVRNGLIKIGKSQNPEKREKTLQSEAPTVEMRFAIPADDSTEGRLHTEYESFRQRGEWFSLSPKQLRQILDVLLSAGDSARVVTNHEWIGKIFLAERVSGTSPFGN